MLRRMLSSQLIFRTLNRVLILTICSLCCHLTFAQQSSTERLFLVQKDGKSGFIDRTGKIVIPIQFDSANDFHEGLALVTMSGRKAFIDATGKIVFNAAYDIVDDFAVANVSGVSIMDTKTGLVSETGFVSKAPLETFKAKIRELAR